MTLTLYTVSFQFIIKLLIVFCTLTSIHSLHLQHQTKVVVTGAGSSVGYHVFKKLLNKKNFYPIGLVRDQNDLQKLVKLGANIDQIRVGDICKKETLRGQFDGAEKCILCTSAKPRFDMH